MAEEPGKLPREDMLELLLQNEQDWQTSCGKGVYLNVDPETAKARQHNRAEHMEEMKSGSMLRSH